jgi:hypothetical protein
MKNLTLLFIAILFVAACNNDDGGMEDYLIFGHHFGFCAGEECLEYFRVTGTELVEYEDNCTPGILSSCIPDSKKLSDAKFTFAQNLIANFPDSLFSETATTIGCPDCADQGGLYLEIKQGDVIRFWDLDNDNSSLPTYLRAYADEVRAAIDGINN